MSEFLGGFDSIFHSTLSFDASHSTYQVSLAEYKEGAVYLTEGGSTKSPRGNGSLIKTVYDGSVAIAVVDG